MEHKQGYGTAICTDCGEEFVKNSSSRKRCYSCVPRKNSWVPKPKECRCCGELFMPRNKSQVFCNKLCNDSRNKYYVYLRDKFTCVYCGSSPITDIKTSLVVDHIKPKSKGGEAKMCNLVTSCNKCNASKLDHELPEDVLSKLLAEVARRNTEQDINPNKSIRNMDSQWR